MTQQRSFERNSHNPFQNNKDRRDTSSRDNSSMFEIGTNKSSNTTDGLFQDTRKRK